MSQSVIGKAISIDDWILDVKEFVNIRSPSLNSILNVYVEEARFGREFINENLQELSYGSSILEVGAGSLLLSSQLVKEGYRVTALEPIGEGFSHFSQLQQLVLEFAAIQNIKPNLVNLHAESLEEDSKFDFAFSVNVMEHVKSVKLTIKNIVHALKANSCYRFTCPNYSFPYEPHFNIPIILNKKLTKAFFKNSIESQKMTDPEGVWLSLNWITVREVRLVVNKLDCAALKFDSGMFCNSLVRVSTDPEFSSRRSAFIIILAKLIILIQLHKLLRYIPAEIQPIIDCTVTKRLK